MGKIVETLKISVIGAGNMGGAMIEGMIASGKISPENIIVSTPLESERERFRRRGASVTDNNGVAAEEGDIVLLAVKPWLVEMVAREIRDKLSEGKPIVSVAAGVTLDFLDTLFPAGTRCFRAMPNIAARQGASMSFVSGPSDDREDMEAVCSVFSLFGECRVVEEKLMDAGMALASCGLAYALRYMRAAMEAAVEMGMPADTARTVAAQTAKGAAEMLLSSSDHPEVLIDKVCTPGGTTIAGLNALEHHGFSSAVILGHLAAFDKVRK